MIRFPNCIKPGLLLGFCLLQLTHASDHIWQGGTSADWHTPDNWVNGVPDVPDERAVFNGTGSRNDLTFATNVDGGSIDNGGTHGILVTGSQKSPVTINAIGEIRPGPLDYFLIFRFSSQMAVNIEYGAGAFSLGTSGPPIIVRTNNVLDATYTFQNDSAYPATLGSRIMSLHGGSGSKTSSRLRFTGNGNWQVDATLELGGTPLLTKDGVGTTTLTGLNTYPGATVIRAGTLKAGVMSTDDGRSAFGRGSEISFSNVPGATLDISNFNTAIGSLAGGGDKGGNVTLGAATLTIGSKNTNTTYAGNISGTGGLLKIGTGTQVLSGANTYTGATTIRNGSLLINTPSGSGLKSENVTVEKNATLGGTGTFTGHLTVRGDGILSPGDGIQSLAGGGLVFNSNSIYSVELDSLAKQGTEADLYVANGDLRLDGPVELRLADIATAPTPFVVGKVFSLINYSGTWNGGANNGFFSWGDRPLTNGAKFTVGPNTWMITYDSQVGGGNFPADQVRGNFVNITAVPGDNSDMNDMIGRPTLIALGAIFASLLAALLVIHKSRGRKPAQAEAENPGR